MINGGRKYGQRPEDAVGHVGNLCAAASKRDALGCGQPGVGRTNRVDLRSIERELARATTTGLHADVAGAVQRHGVEARPGNLPRWLRNGLIKAAVSPCAIGEDQIDQVCIHRQRCLGGKRREILQLEPLCHSGGTTANDRIQRTAERIDSGLIKANVRCAQVYSGTCISTGQRIAANLQVAAQRQIDRAVKRNHIGIDRQRIKPARADTVDANSRLAERQRRIRLAGLEVNRQRRPIHSADQQFAWHDHVRRWPAIRRGAVAGCLQRD